MSLQCNGANIFSLHPPPAAVENVAVSAENMEKDALCTQHVATRPFINTATPHKLDPSRSFGRVDWTQHHNLLFAGNVFFVGKAFMPSAERINPFPTLYKGCSNQAARTNPSRPRAPSIDDWYTNRRDGQRMRGKCDISTAGRMLESNFFAYFLFAKESRCRAAQAHKITSFIKRTVGHVGPYDKQPYFRR